MAVAVAGGVSDSRRRLSRLCLCLCPPAQLQLHSLTSIWRPPVALFAREIGGGRLTLLLCGPRLGRPAGWPAA